MFALVKWRKCTEMSTDIVSNKYFYWIRIYSRAGNKCMQYSKRGSQSAKKSNEKEQRWCHSPFFSCSLFLLPYNKTIHIVVFICLLRVALSLFKGNSIWIYTMCIRRTSSLFFHFISYVCVSKFIVDVFVGMWLCVYTLLCVCVLFYIPLYYIIIWTCVWAMNTFVYQLI